MPALGRRAPDEIGFLLQKRKGAGRKQHEVGPPIAGDHDGSGACFVRDVAETILQIGGGKFLHGGAGLPMTFGSNISLIS